MFIERYKAQRASSVKPATVNRDLACLKHMFSTAIKWELTKINPMRRVKLFKETPLPLRILTDGERSRLINECSSWLKPIVITALHTGMRLREILDLEWHFVDMHRRVITVTMTKTQENRLIPINSFLASVLAGLPKSSRYVFPNPEGKPFNNIHKGFYAAVRRAGIGHFRFHDLRHNFASQLVMEGIDLVTVKELLGHKEITTTMRYAYLNNEHKMQALERLQARYGHNMVTELKLAET